MDASNTLSVRVGSVIDLVVDRLSYLILVAILKRLAKRVRYIKTFEDLDRELDEAAVLAKTSDAAFREKLQGLCYVCQPEPNQDTDPLSMDYRAAQLRLYERIARKPYAVSNEHTDFDFDEALRWPFPYARAVPI